MSITLSDSLKSALWMKNVEIESKSYWMMLKTIRTFYFQ